MAKNKISLEEGRIPHIASERINEVFITLTLDRRRTLVSGLTPIVVRVAYNKGNWYKQTSVAVSEEDYISILKAGTQGKWHKQKSYLLTYFHTVTDAVKELMSDGFSLEKLKERVGKRSASAKSDLFTFWIEYADTKSAYKTQSQYKTALSSFKEYRRDVNLSVADVTTTMIDDWRGRMEERGNSEVTQSMYMRALRALLRHAHEKGVIAKVPKMEIPAGNRRRTDNFLTVTDILRLQTFVSPKKWNEMEKENVQRAIDWWLILYCCNGCNTIDLAKLTWNDTYFYDKELSFVRSKTEGKSRKEVVIKVPIIPQLEELLKKHGSTPKQGELVFPQIIGEAKTLSQIDNRVHDFNKEVIRRWLALPCTELSIRPATAQFARNSFITCLTHHGVSDSYIDRAVGHADNLLRGYQGEFSLKKRRDFNSLLFIEPEE